MAFLFLSTWHDTQAWIDAFREAAPGIDLRIYPDLGDTADIDFAVGWRPPAGIFAELPNLKVLHSLGAGVESMIHDPTLRPEVTVCRVVEDRLTLGMSEYVLLHVLRYHRRLDELIANQKARRWDFFPPAYTPSTTVGILGLGRLGIDAGEKLAALGFRVVGWSQTEKQVRGIESYAGPGQFDDFLRVCDMLVCLLPLTPETTGILNRRNLGLLKRGAYLINAGRGGHLVDADLLALLDEGHIAAATLDVFHQEPLPADNPFWDHPRITVTPHNASDSLPQPVARMIIDQYERFRSGRPLANIVDRTKGY
ncbi:MAG: glyoxylate/hydroxypyruvate reductase A [Alphaproteobacteria bacterium]|jgi:glyoxylate/hydroxypyruvate reductase A|nr:glyoxylate/hydroxypyruvate reductase A [Alphaproteobacteria bacterium]